MKRFYSSENVIKMIGGVKDEGNEDSGKTF
jgi:hypothetical protein